MSDDELMLSQSIDTAATAIFLAIALFVLILLATLAWSRFSARR